MGTHSQTAGKEMEIKGPHDPPPLTPESSRPDVVVMNQANVYQIWWQVCFEMPCAPLASLLVLKQLWLFPRADLGHTHSLVSQLHRVHTGRRVLGLPALLPRPAPLLSAPRHAHLGHVTLFVWPHLAANTDVRQGPERPQLQPGPPLQFVGTRVHAGHGGTHRECAGDDTSHVGVSVGWCALRGAGGAEEGKRGQNDGTSGDEHHLSRLRQTVNCLSNHGSVFSAYVNVEQ